MKLIEKNIWDKQPWETNLAYHAFFNYYLPQKVRPRSLSAAYREYAKNEKGKIADVHAGQKINVPGAWYKWYAAVDSNFKRYIDRYTWEERAEAWERYHDELVAGAMTALKNEVLNDEMRDYHTQLHSWNKLINTMVFTIDREEQTNPKFKPENYVKPMAELVKMREQIAIFGRRIVELPATITQNKITDGEGGPLTIVWKDPFENGDSDIGLGAEVVNQVIEKKRIERLENTTDE